MTTPVLGPIETDRLLLRPQEPGDAEVFHQLWTERDPRVPPHRRLVDGRPGVDDIAARIAAADLYAGGPRLLTVVLADTGSVLGYCGLNGHGSGTPEEPELAFELRGSAQGHGYATEAGRAVVSRARDAGHPRLRAGVWSWNLASRRVLAKLGFREVRRIEPTSEHGHTLLTVLDL